MTQTEENLFNFLKEHNLEEIVAGTPLEWKKVPKKNVSKISAILLHCCINGPVSPNKPTTYPVVGEACLNDLVGDQKVTNSGLKKTCEGVARWLETQGFESGFQKTKGSFWPLNL
jgi:hypothetical protein